MLARASLRPVNGSTPDRPTGFAPSALPLHELSDGEFEQFCTDFLNLHPIIWCKRGSGLVTRRIVGAQRLLSGTNQHGGDIRADAEEGDVWVFQCKKVKQFHPSDIQEAIDRAERGWPHADQYMLLTTCGLSAESQALIHGRAKWMWWDASRITSEVQKLEPREHGMNLVQRFGKEWVRRLFVWGDQPFLTWVQFFADDVSPDRRHFHHRTSFQPRSEPIERIEAFARDGAGRALILSAAGGQGKSRLLLELARKLEQEPGAPRVRFLTLTPRGLTEDQADLLGREGDLVLVVDDAHRLVEVLGDVARAATKAKSIRLVVVTRPQAEESIRSQFYRQGYAERLETILHLPEWKSSEMQALAEQVLDPAHRWQAARLAHLADRCPLLVVLGGELINTGGLPGDLTDDSDFRERVFKGFKEDFLRLQPESGRHRLDRLMQFLAFVSPTPKSDRLLTKAAEILGCDPLEVDADLGLLEGARLVVENREGLRLYPDLFADSVMLDASLDRAGQPSFLHRTVLAKLPIEDFPSLLRNVAQADWEARVKRGAAHSLFDPIWDEFVRRFNAGEWQESGTDFGWKQGTNTSAHQPDRGKMLRNWSDFAVFLPKRTVELARLAQERAVESTGSSILRDVLPAMLKPILLWHSPHTVDALNILWSLEEKTSDTDPSIPSEAINAIAEAASFAWYRPLEASQAVADWLHAKVREPATVNRLRRQPWILSALLKPFFGREVEHSWTAGRTVHMASCVLSAERTRPLRLQALEIVDEFLNSNDAALVHAVIPVLAETIQPIRPKFASDQPEKAHEAWRPDRLESVRRLERAVKTYKDSPAFLIPLRRIVRDRCRHDPDAEVLRECERVRDEMPDTFELRAAIALSSTAHEEYDLVSGPDLGSSFEEADRRWTAYCGAVAREAAGRFRDASALCGYIRRLALELSAGRSAVLAGVLLGEVASISKSWCTGMLEELIWTSEPALDDSMRPVIERAADDTPVAYRRAVEWLPTEGRPEQVRALISYLGWKHIHGGGLEGFERQSLLQLAERTEPTVVSTLAWVSGLHFHHEPAWAMEVLGRLHPTSETTATDIMESLARLTEQCGPVLDPGNVAECLTRAGEHLLAHGRGGERWFHTLARAFPRVVYERLREIVDAPEPIARTRLGVREVVPLGSVRDEIDLPAEMLEQWNKVLAERNEPAPRLALIRSLLWSDSERVPERLEALIAACRDGEELQLAARLAAIQGSRFAFDRPELVRLLLDRAASFDAATAVREILWLSALGGSRGLTNGRPDPEYRYRLEQGDALANRYRDDSVLGPFYRTISDSRMSLNSILALEHVTEEYRDHVQSELPQEIEIEDQVQAGQEGDKVNDPKEGRFAEPAVQSDPQPDAQRDQRKKPQAQLEGPPVDDGTADEERELDPIDPGEGEDHGAHENLLGQSLRDQEHGDDRSRAVGEG